jgi:hypothetical protein
MKASILARYPEANFFGFGGTGCQPERPDRGDKGCRHKRYFFQPFHKLPDLRRGDALRDEAQVIERTEAK